MISVAGHAVGGRKRSVSAFGEIHVVRSEARECTVDFGTDLDDHEILANLEGPGVRLSRRCDHVLIARRRKTDVRVHGELRFHPREDIAGLRRDGVVVHDRLLALRRNTELLERFWNHHFVDHHVSPRGFSNVVFGDAAPSRQMLHRRTNVDVVLIRLLQVRHHLDGPARAPYTERNCSTLEHQPASQPQIGKANDVVGMQVREKDALYLPPSNVQLREPLQRAASRVEQEFWSPASTSVLGPKRFMTGGGQPVPSSVTFS